MLLDQMRDATEEKIKSINEYIKSISKDIGINFFDLLEEWVLKEKNHVK